MEAHLGAALVVAMVTGAAASAVVARGAVPGVINLGRRRGGRGTGEKGGGLLLAVAAALRLLCPAFVVDMFSSLHVPHTRATSLHLLIPIVPG